MNDITNFIKDTLISRGADLVGFADLSDLPTEQRFNMPAGVAIAVKYPKETIKSIVDMPTKDYHDMYIELNEKLDRLVRLGADALRTSGYEAIAQSLDFVKESPIDYTTRLPHKTVATRAGLGWIGKSALIITKEFGSMIRLTSILTNAPLKTDTPITTSQCGDCMNCVRACPAGAVLGRNWTAGLERDAFFDAYLCRKTARERTKRSINIEMTLCGKCIVVCPYTQRYLAED